MNSDQPQTKFKYFSKDFQKNKYDKAKTFKE